MSDRFIEEKVNTPFKQKIKRTKYPTFYDGVSNKQLKIKLPKDHLPLRVTSVIEYTHQVMSDAIF